MSKKEGEGEEGSQGHVWQMYKRKQLFFFTGKASLRAAMIKKNLLLFRKSRKGGGVMSNSKLFMINKMCNKNLVWSGLVWSGLVWSSLVWFVI